MSKEDELGALWLKDGKNGKYFSGKITVDGQDIGIVIFKNTYKEKENQPDYKILRSRPRSDAPVRQPDNNRTVTAENFEDDIPF